MYVKQFNQFDFPHVLNIVEPKRTLLCKVLLYWWRLINDVCFSEPVHYLVVPVTETLIFRRKTSRSTNHIRDTVSARRSFAVKNKGFSAWGKIVNRLSEEFRNTVHCVILSQQE